MRRAHSWPFRLTSGILTTEKITTSEVTTGQSVTVPTNSTLPANNMPTEGFALPSSSNKETLIISVSVVTCLVVIGVVIVMLWALWIRKTKLVTAYSANSSLYRISPTNELELADFSKDFVIVPDISILSKLGEGKFGEGTSNNDYSNS